MPPRPAVQVYPVDTLEEMTQAFWDLSKKYHRNEGLLTVGDAIETTREILANAGPQRVVAKRAWEIQEMIVNGGKK